MTEEQEYVYHTNIKSIGLLIQINSMLCIDDEEEYNHYKDLAIPLNKIVERINKKNRGH